MGDSPTMTVREVAGYLNVDEKKTVYTLSKQGEQPRFKVAGTWRFTRSDIDAWVDEQKKQRGKARRRL